MDIRRQFLARNGTQVQHRILPANPSGTNESDRELEITVVFTSAEATVAAIDRAAALLNGLNGRISLVAAQSVPYPLPLESPLVLLDFNEQRLIEIASESPVETTVDLYLCRSRLDTLASVLKPASVVIIGGRRRWWPTWETRLARGLEYYGIQVILLDTARYCLKRSCFVY